jgi:hypothetical protein
MKKILILVGLIFSLHGFSQDSTKVEQYCEVTASGKLFSTKVTIDVDYGDERSFWKDHRLKDDDGKLKKFNSVIDALNYLGKAGWKLVNAYPVYNGSSSNIYHYVFKKEFSKAEADQ